MQAPLFLRLPPNLDSDMKTAEDALLFCSFVVPVYNSMPELVGCVTSLLGEVERYGRAEVIVVDNGSTDGSLEYLERHPASQLRVLDRPTASIGELRNAGAKDARGQVLCFLDSDCLVRDGYLTAVSQVLSRGTAEASGSMVVPPESPGWIERTWYDLHARRKDAYVKYLNSGNFAIRKDVFDEVGGFREDLASGEDAELGQRLNDAGFRIFECHEISAVHLGNPKSLRDFLRRHTWHGVGMMGTTGRSRLDKPVVMLLVHLALAGMGFGQLVVGPGPWLVRVAAILALLLTVPSLTVAYRYINGGGGGRPVREVFLYFLYYVARARALGIILARKILPWRRGGDGSGSAERTAKSFRPR